MPRLLREGLRYVGVSALAFALDLALLTLQVELLGIPYLAAAAVSFLAGTVFVYWASITHVFGYRRLESAHIEFGLFALVGVIALGLNLVVIYAAVDAIGLHYLLAKFAAAACTFLVNFGLRRWFLFSPWRDGKSSSTVEELTSR